MKNRRPKAAPAPAAPPPAPWRKSTLREYFEALATAVILALFVRTFVVQAFKIPTGSMENNLLIGDHLLVNKMVLAPSPTAIDRLLLPVRDVRRGDVVVFKYPEDPERDFIKRVIGLPGEALEVREKRVYIDGKRLDEPYVHYLEPPSGPTQFHEFTSYDLRERYGPVTVPPGQYFVMGDNRDNSQDSRYWGFLPREYIKGRALMIYWSYESRPEDYMDSGIGPSLKRLFAIATHFFTRTRWDRIFDQVR
ncbi:MAG: lepB [Acidobacteria bacterium]|nr:lepB [Acidobacteriota bacterium]